MIIAILKSKHKRGELMTARRGFSTIVTLIMILTMMPLPVQATISGCTVTATPATTLAASNGMVTLHITNNDGATAANWIHIQQPSASYSLTGVDQTGWIVGGDASSQYFSSGSMNPGSSQDFGVTFAASPAQIAPEDWIVQLSDSNDSTNAVNCTGARSTQITGHPDNTVSNGVSNVAAVDITNGSATITWHTDSPSSSIVYYGTTSGYGEVTTFDPNQLNEHSVGLTGLVAGTAYHYQVAGNDSGSTNYWSTDNTVLTSGTNPSSGSGGSGGSSSGAGNNGGATAPPVGVVKVPIKEIPIEKEAPKITLIVPAKTVFADAPKFSGTATDNDSVARIEFSIDGGANWQVVADVKSLGSKSTAYSFTPVFSQDDDYQLMTRAIDASGNIGTSVLVKVTEDRLPPVVGDAVVNVGPQIIDPDTDGAFATIVGIDQTITVKSVGGATSINLQASRVGTGGAASSFGLTRSSSGLWSGVVSFPSAGTYEVSALAIDGAGNKTKRLLARFKVGEAAQLVDAKTNTPIMGRMTLYYRIPNTVNWVPWDGSGFGVANPVTTSKTGNFNLYLPKGDYYLSVTAQGYRNTYSKVFTLNEAGPLAGKMGLNKSAIFKLGSLTVNWPAFLSDKATFTLSTPAVTAALEQSTPLRQFSLPTTDGSTLTAASLRGHATVISTFSTWLPASSQQLADLAAAQKVLPDARVIGLDELESVSRVQALLAISKLDFSVVVDSQGTLAGAFGPTGVPANVFVDRHGMIKKVIYGIMTKAEIVTGLRGL